MQNGTCAALDQMLVALDPQPLHPFATSTRETSPAPAIHLWLRRVLRMVSSLTLILDSNGGQALVRQQNVAAPEGTNPPSVGSPPLGRQEPERGKSTTSLLPSGGPASGRSKQV